MLTAEDRIKEYAKKLGADVCGIADIHRFQHAPEGFHPRDLYAQCNSVIVSGIALPKGLYDVDSRLIYGYFNESVCPKVDDISFRLAKYLEDILDAAAIPLPCDAPYDYWDKAHLTGKGLLSMKHAAVQAGIGTLGKSTLLLNAQYGNRLVVGAVLTNLPLHADPMASAVCLEGCTRCIDACPTQAIQNGHVDQSLCRPFSYGSTARGFGTVECNRCRTQCPMRLGKQAKKA